MNVTEYGGHYQTFKTSYGSSYLEQKTGSRYVVGDFSTLDLNYCVDSDLFYCDPPWNTAITKTFYKQAELEFTFDFKCFLDVFFNVVATLNCKTAYIEIGKQNASEIERRLKRLYPAVQSWVGTYYKKSPMIYFRGGKTPSAIDLTGIDDAKSPSLVIETEHPDSVCDICLGLGATPIASFKHNIKFVGSELNHKRLASALHKLVKSGASIIKES